MTKFCFTNSRFVLCFFGQTLMALISTKISIGKPYRTIRGCVVYRCMMAKESMAPLSPFFSTSYTSDGGNLIISNRELHEVAKVCRDSAACKGFNTDNWVKIVIRPFDEWDSGTSLKRSGCKGIFVKPDVDFCRDGIPGYKFYETFDRYALQSRRSHPLVFFESSSFHSMPC